MTAEIDKKVLEIVSAQSPDYPIHPEATAFLVEGLPPGEVEAALLRLHEQGHVRHVTQIAVESVLVTETKRVGKRRRKAEVPQLDEDGNPQYVDRDVVDERTGEPMVIDHGFVAAPKADA